MPSAPGMKAKNLDDVLVYRKSVAAADEISALLKRPIFRKDLELISEEELGTYDGKYIEIGKMLTPWINYLQRTNWKTRGQPPDPKTDD
jgi:hypothetical protein